VLPDLPSAFARSAAYGDIIAAALALLALASLPSGTGFVVAWVFNLWGTADLLNAFYQANSGRLQPGQLGATYFIPTVLVPLLLITHGLVFRILLRPQNVSTGQPPGGRVTETFSRIEKDEFAARKGSGAFLE
jgi:hypothetical protein